MKPIRVNYTFGDRNHQAQGILIDKTVVNDVCKGIVVNPLGEIELIPLQKLSVVRGTLEGKTDAEKELEKEIARLNGLLFDLDIENRCLKGSRKEYEDLVNGTMDLMSCEIRDLTPMTCDALKQLILFHLNRMDAEERNMYLTEENDLLEGRYEKGYEDGQNGK